MEPKKRWDGYRSFSYLEAGRDYREFELPPQAADALYRHGRVVRSLLPEGGALAGGLKG